jgi:hypothetical protein
MMAKDVRLYLDEAKQAGSGSRLAGAIDGLWSALNRGEPGADFTRIYPFVKNGYKRP